MKDVQRIEEIASVWGEKMYRVFFSDGSEVVTSNPSRYAPMLILAV